VLLAGAVVLLGAATLLVASRAVARAAAELVAEITPSGPVSDDLAQISSDLLLRVEDLGERSRDATVPEDPAR
jgi:hypothetical protein